MFAQTASIDITMHRTQTNLCITAPMPGLRPEAIAVRINDKRLQLRGDVDATYQTPGDLVCNEWGIGSYYREIELPVEIDQTPFELLYEHGMLTLNLPIKHPQTTEN
jgi:HSP20 family protein